MIDALLAVTLYTASLAGALLWPDRAARLLLAGALLVVASHLLTLAEALDALNLPVLLTLFSLLVAVRAGEATGLWRRLVDRWAAAPGRAGFLAGLALSALLAAPVGTIRLLPILTALARDRALPVWPVALAVAIGGLSTPTGSPANLVIGAAAQADAPRFLASLGPLALLLAAWSTLWVSLWQRAGQKIARGEPGVPLRLGERGGAQASSPLTPTERWTLLIGGMLAAGLLGHRLLGQPLAVVALAGVLGLTVLAGHDPRRLLRPHDWALLVGLAALFVLVGGLVRVGGPALVAEGMLALTGGQPAALVLGVFGASLAFGGLLGALVWTVTAVPLLKDLELVVIGLPLWWALAAGAMIGETLALSLGWRRCALAAAGTTWPGARWALGWAVGAGLLAAAYLLWQTPGVLGE